MSAGEIEEALHLTDLMSKGGRPFACFPVSIQDRQVSCNYSLLLAAPNTALPLCPSNQSLTKALEWLVDAMNVPKQQKDAGVVTRAPTPRPNDAGAEDIEKVLERWLEVHVFLL